MAAAGWLRRAAAATALPRLPSGLPLMPTPPPAPLPEAQSLVLPGLGTALGPAMELMAVPKKKISKYKRGLRNGPKALKHVPVIVRCRCIVAAEKEGTLVTQAHRYLFPSLEFS